MTTSRPGLRTAWFIGSNPLQAMRGEFSCFIDFSDPKGLDLRERVLLTFAPIYFQGLSSQS